MVAPAGHFDLRKRNSAAAARVGKRNAIKPVDPLDTKRKPVPRWLVWTFLLLLGGGFLFEFLNLFVNYFFPAQPRYSSPGRRA